MTERVIIFRTELKNHYHKCASLGFSHLFLEEEIIEYNYQKMNCYNLCIMGMDVADQSSKFACSNSF